MRFRSEYSGAAVCVWIRTLGWVPGVLWGKGTGLLWDFGKDAVLLLGLQMEHHSRPQVLQLHLWGRRELTVLGCKPGRRCAGLQPHLSHGKAAKTWQSRLQHMQAIWIHEVLQQRGQGCQSCYQCDRASRLGLGSEGWLWSAWLSPARQTDGKQRIKINLTSTDSSYHKNLLPKSKKAQLAAVLPQKVMYHSPKADRESRARLKVPSPAWELFFLHIFILLTDQNVLKGDMHTHTD